MTWFPAGGCSGWGEPQRAVRMLSARRSRKAGSASCVGKLAI